MAMKDKHGNECSHRLPVHIYTLAPPKSFSYLWSVTFAEKAYGSVGIWFNVVRALCPVIKKEHIVKLKRLDTTNQWDENSDEQDLLLRTLGLGAYKGVAIFIVASIWDTEDRESLAGGAGHKPSKPAALVSATDGTDYTMAHEVGHVLLGSDWRPVHTTVNSNIMIGGTWQIPNKSAPTFNSDQVSEMKKSRYLQTL